MRVKREDVSQPLGVASVLICLLIATIRGGNPVAIKLVLRSLSPMQGAFIRVAIGCASIGLYSLARDEDLRPRRAELGPIALLSLIYAIQISANQTGSDYTSPVFVAILFNTYPILANLVSSFVVPEDRLTPLRGIGLAVAFTGVAWVFLSRIASPLAPNPLLGNSLIIVAATLLAFRMVYLRQLTLRISYIRAVFWPLIGSLPLFLLGAAAIPDAMPRLEPDWRIAAALVFQGVIVGGAGQLAWVYLLRKHTPGTVIAFSFLTPVSGVLMSSSYFDEPVPARLVAGLAAVLLGIGLAARSAHPAGTRDRPGLPRVASGPPEAGV